MILTFCCKDTEALYGGSRHDRFRAFQAQAECISYRCLILLILSMIYAALQVTAWRSYQVIGWGDGVFELTTNGVFAFALRTEMPMMLRLSITIKEIDCDN